MVHKCNVCIILKEQAQGGDRLSSPAVKPRLAHRVCYGDTIQKLGFRTFAEWFV